jgi:hypothetical protein
MLSLSGNLELWTTLLNRKKSGTGSAYPGLALGVHPIYSGVRIAQAYAL